MTLATSQAEAVLSYIEKQRGDLVQLAVELGNAYTPAGYEKPGADLVYGWLQKNGFEAFMQRVVEDRYNVISFLTGSGGGKSLLFNSHLDVQVYPGSELKAWVDGDLIIGNAVVNNKGPMAAWLMAAKAIKMNGHPLKGDLVLTAVVGEVGAAEIDEFQGPRYLGKGLGSLHAVRSGITADYALVAETTDFAPTWAEAGDVWFKVTVKGSEVYTPRLADVDAAEHHPNAIVKTAKLILVMQEWARKYTQKYTVEFEGGTITPKVSVGAIRGGRPFHPTNTARECNLYVDVRLPPGVGYGNALDDLRSIINATGIEAEIRPYLYRRGYIAQDVEELTKAVNDAHEYVFHTKPARINSPETSMWRDINVFNEAGIPAITYGPGRTKTKYGDINYGTNGLKITDLVSASKVYALIALTVCNMPKS